MMQTRSDPEFLRLVKENQGLIHKVCLMYERNEESRKDLFQEIVLQLWRSYSSYKGDAKISTWMYRIALNTAISSFRKAKRSPVSLEMDDHVFQIPEDPEAVLRKEQFQMLLGAINHLNEIEKAIMMLYLDEVPYEEIAETLGITQNNVRVKMNRIREKLKTIISRQYGT